MTMLLEFLERHRVRHLFRSSHLKDHPLFINHMLNKQGQPFSVLHPSLFSFSDCLKALSSGLVHSV